MAVQLYLIRHGIAVVRHPQIPDETRALTPVGIEKTQKMAQRLYDLGLKFETLLTSPLVRAQQTATLLQEAGLCATCDQSPLLAPEGSFQEWLLWLQDWQGLGHNSLALVGHQPNLGEWTERLIWSEARQALVLKKAGIIGVTLPDGGDPVGNSSLFWLTPPRYLL